MSSRSYQYGTPPKSSNRSSIRLIPETLRSTMIGPSSSHSRSTLLPTELKTLNPILMTLSSKRNQLTVVLIASHPQVAASYQTTLQHFVSRTYHDQTSLREDLPCLYDALASCPPNELTDSCESEHDETHPSIASKL
jgi:hypothetical protein